MFKRDGRFRPNCLALPIYDDHRTAASSGCAMTGNQEKSSVENIGVFNSANFRGLRPAQPQAGLLESRGARALRAVPDPGRDQARSRRCASGRDWRARPGRSPKDKFVVRDETTESTVSRRDNNGSITPVISTPCCGISSPMPRARSCSRRTSTAAPIRERDAEVHIS